MNITHRVDTKTIRLVLKLPRLFGFRNWMSIQLIKLLSMVSPLTIDLQHD